MMKVIHDTTENLQDLLDYFDVFGIGALTSIGREFTEDGHLINISSGKNHSSTTNTYDVVHEDSEQGFYITHPEAFRGRWDDEYVDGLIDLIPETATENLEFIRTPQDEA